MNELINIKNKEGKLIVSSREIAKNFEKEHREVINAIEGRECSCNGTGCKKCSNRGYQQIGILGMGDKSHLSKMFIQSEYKDSMNRNQKEYLLTRDGFTLLAMGFTGRKALEWKLKYIEAFNKMETALKEVYHISETAIVNNIMDNLESKIFTGIDERLSRYEENYRPTHANKINLNNYIKKGLGDFAESEEVDLVKERILLVLDARAWQDIPYEKLTNSMHVIDESIRAVKSFRSKKQLSVFEN